MSRFNPTIRIIEPANQPDTLAAALLDSLSKPLYRRLSFGPVAAFVLTIFTLGFVPLLAMTRWLRGFILIQQQQFWHLAEWLRLHTSDPDAQKLQQSAEKFRFSAVLATLMAVGLLFAAGAVVRNFIYQPFSIKALYRFAFQGPLTAEWIVFIAALSAAAACHWTHVLCHQLNVQQYLHQFNQIAARQGVREIPLPSPQLGIRLIWAIGGIILASRGALWGLPMMLAAGAHRRYIMRDSVQLRAELADRLRSMLVQRRPQLNIQRPLAVSRQCIRPNCQAAMPTIANYCPRCGTRAAERLSGVA